MPGVARKGEDGLVHPSYLLRLRVGSHVGRRRSVPGVARKGEDGLVHPVIYLGYAWRSHAGEA